MATEQDGTSSERLLREIPWKAFAAALIVGALGIAAYGSAASDPLPAVAAGSLVAAGALAFGGFIGFLFGIPRAPDKTPEAARTGAEGASKPTAGRSRPNTNLEEISDWLTKILVGVGLVQIASLPSAIRGLTDYLSPALGDTTSSGPFVACLLVYFTITGFLAVFLWTRVYLLRVLRYLDVEELQEIRAETQSLREQLEAQARADRNTLSKLDAILDAGAGSPAPEAGELKTMLESVSPTARDRIFEKTSLARNASWRNNKRSMERTIPIFQALLSLQERESVFDEPHRLHAQLGYALKDKPEPDYQGAEQELTMAIDLRGHWEDRGWLFYEFNRAAARIGMDPAFPQGHPSAAVEREKVLRDLRAAASEPFLYSLILGKEARILEWLKANKINPEDLIS